MRVAIIDYSDLSTDESKESIAKGISSKYRKCFYFDYFLNEPEEAEYCIEIRNYDCIFIEYNHDNKPYYLNLLKIIHETYELDYKMFLFVKKEDKENYRCLKNYAKENFPSLKIIYTVEEDSSLDIINMTSFFAERFFLHELGIKNFEVDMTTRTVILNPANKEEQVSLYIKKEFDFKVLVSFLRHNGQIINIDSLADAITDEPEYLNQGPIECSIASLRGIFKTKNIPNPIKAHKRVGYSLSI